MVITKNEGKVVKDRANTETADPALRAELRDIARVAKSNKFKK